MCTGARPLSHCAPHIRGIYYFSSASLLSSAAWLGFGPGTRLPGTAAGPHQHSAEVKSRADAAFPGDSAAWLMAVPRARPGSACRYNSFAASPLCQFPSGAPRRCIRFPRGRRLSLHSSQPQSSPSHSPPVLLPLAPLSLSSLWQAPQCGALQWVLFHSTVRASFFFFSEKSEYNKSAALNWGTTLTASQ